MTIMIDHIFAKIYGLILAKNISLWLKIHGKRAKGKDGLRRDRSTIDHLVTLRIIPVECHNNKTDIFYYLFYNFRKAFDIFLQDTKWTRLEEIMVPL